MLNVLNVLAVLNGDARGQGNNLFYGSHLMQIDMPAHSALCSIFGGFYGYGVVWGRK